MSSKTNCKVEQNENEVAKENSYPKDIINGREESVKIDVGGPMEWRKQASRKRPRVSSFKV